MMYMSGAVAPNSHSELITIFVNIGHLKTQQGQLGRIAAIRVDFIDDDLP